MNRLARVAASVAVLLLAAPVPPASACTPARPGLDVDRDRVARGARVTVSGKELAYANGGYGAVCDLIHPPPMSPTPTVDPPETATPSPSGSPLVSLPPLRPVAFVPGRPVTVTVREYREWPAPDAPERTLAEVPTGRRVPYEKRDGLFVYSFEATVTLPRDLRPGRWVLKAFEKDGVYYGEAQITVTRGLAATGPNPFPTTFGLLLLGGAALLVRQQQAHRLGAGRRAVAERAAHR